MATFVIKTFNTHLRAGLPARIRGIWHILCIGQWAFHWKAFNDDKNAFELTYHTPKEPEPRTYWLGVTDRFQLVVTTEGDLKELPLALKTDLDRLVDRSDGGTSLYYPTSKPASAGFPLSASVTFKANLR